MYILRVLQSPTIQMYTKELSENESAGCDYLYCLNRKSVKLFNLKYFSNDNLNSNFVP